MTMFYAKKGMRSNKVENVRYKVCTARYIFVGTRWGTKMPVSYKHFHWLLPPFEVLEHAEYLLKRSQKDEILNPSVLIFKF